MLIGKPAHSEQMENLIQLFLWLQVSACRDKGKAAICGKESEGVSVAPLEGRVPPEPRRVEAMQLQKCPFELHALETTRRNARGERWKTIASGVQKHPPARCWYGQFNNPSAKSGGESHFICGTPALGTLGTKGPLNDISPWLPPAWAHIWALPRVYSSGSCAWARRSQARLQTHQNPK